MVFETNIKRLKAAYLVAKGKKKGEECVCPSCGSTFVKGSYQQVFCKRLPGTVCKDNYWNNVTPNKRNNQTRISPASASWSENRESYIEDYDPGDSEYWDNKNF